MKIEKNKIVFGSLLIIVLLFLIVYTTLVFMGDRQEPQTLDQPLVPEIRENTKQYTSKLAAIDELKEERKFYPPSIYSQELLDSSGAYAPAQEDKELILDSIYRHSVIGIVQDINSQESQPPKTENKQEETPGFMQKIEDLPDLSLHHDKFFLAGNTPNLADPEVEVEDPHFFLAEVNGSQTVGTNDRLELVLKEEINIDGTKLDRNSLIYAFVSLHKNRVFLNISHIGQHPVKMKVYDLQDSNEGIYVRNTFRAQARREVVDDVVQDINIAGMPQVGGVKNIFRRQNRNLRVTILDQYQLMLKSQL